MLEKKSVFDVTDNKLDKNQREFIKALSVIFDSILKGQIMTNRFETNGTLSSDYGIVKSIENSQSDLEQLAWNRKVL